MRYTLTYETMNGVRHTYTVNAKSINNVRKNLINDFFNPNIAKRIHKANSPKSITVSKDGTVMGAMWQSYGNGYGSKDYGKIVWRSGNKHYYVSKNGSISRI